MPLYIRISYHLPYRSPAPFYFRRIPLGVCIKLRRALDRSPQEYVRSGVHPLLLMEPLKVISRSYLQDFLVYLSMHCLEVVFVAHIFSEQPMHM